MNERIVVQTLHELFLYIDKQPRISKRYVPELVRDFFETHAGKAALIRYPERLPAGTGELPPAPHELLCAAHPRQSTLGDNRHDP